MRQQFPAQRKLLAEALALLVEKESKQLNSKRGD